MIRYIQTGFLGHLNDAQQFALMDQLGTGLEFPDNCNLLGDKIYPNRGNVVTQFTAQQIARKPGNQRRHMKFLYGKENYALNLFICLGVTYSSTEWSACIMFTANFQHFDMSM